MATDVEIEIASLLSTKESSADLARQISEKISFPDYNSSEKITFLNLLIQMGFYREALKAILTFYKKDPQRFPWKQLLFLLSQTKTKPTQEMLDTIFEGVKKEGLLDELGAFKEWEDWDSRFKEARQLAHNNKKEEQRIKGEELENRIQFLRTQRLYEEEKQTLHQLQCLFPRNHKIQSQLKEIETIWSRDIISKSNSKRESWLTSNKPKLKKDSALIEQANHLLAFIQEHGNFNNTQLYNLALFFKFVEAPQQALEVLKDIDSFEANWLRIDVYLDSGQYVTALDELSRLEQKYADFPETSFSVIYSKAIALKNLGQTPAAIELMQKITKVETHYRAAHQYLANWEQSWESS